jgi:hypothetical protein
MSASQYIFLALIAIITWGAFVEATSHSKTRFTVGRISIALMVPALWTALVIFMRWDLLDVISRSPFTWWPIAIVLGIFGPVSFVGTIVIWVGAALAGDLPNPFRLLVQQLRRQVGDKK